MVERIPRKRAMAIADAMAAEPKDSDTQASNVRALTRVGGAPAPSPADQVDSPVTCSPDFRP